MTRLRTDGTQCPPFGLRRNGTRYTTTCDHDPARPRLELARPIPEGLPPLIYQAMEKCRRIYTHPHEFPEFEFPWLLRERRSQRREALALVGQAEILRMDLASHRVGQAIRGTPYLEGLPIAQIAPWTGLTYSRAARASEDFTAAGYQFGSLDNRGRLCAPQPKETRTDPQTGERTYRARAAVRRFTPLMFRRLGLGLAAAAAAKRASAKRREQAAADAAALAEVARQERDRLHAIRAARIAKQRSARATETTWEEGKRFTAHALDVRSEHPDWVPEAQRAEANRRVAAEAKRATGPPE